MGEDDKSYKQGKRKNDNFDGNSGSEVEKPAKHVTSYAPQKSIVRRQVDPETTKYFSKIANLFQSNSVDLEERVVICGNALEETRGKEFHLATDYIISHTLEMLLQGCDVDSLCSFLRSCADDFPFIAMDRSGSHVAESAIRSLAVHLQDTEVYPLIEDTLTMICEVIVQNPIHMMCDCYGSHVLRSLLSLCKGVPLGSSKSDGAKSSKVLAERLNFKASRSEENALSQDHQGFPDLLKFLVTGIFYGSRECIKTLQIDQYSSLVLQAALKASAGDDDELLKIIPVLLGCKKKDAREGHHLESNKVQHVVHLMKETVFSHLMEVILEVAPEVLYREMLAKVFKNSLFELSSHQCGNFVVQALVTHARQNDHMELIWEELGPMFKDILEMGRSGLIASIIAASQRLHAREEECCRALVAAVSSENESPRCIVPRILFLDSYFRCGDVANWKWPRGVRMHIIGSLILQEVFRYPSAYTQPFVSSILALEADYVLESAKDTAGARVIEAFISSDVSAQVKRRLIAKLGGHFGELGMHMSGSFTVEKCFAASNISLQEAIVSELSAVQSELSKTKQGPHLMRKLDVYRFASHPDQWRSKLAAKHSVRKEFRATFGSGEIKSSKSNNFLSQTAKNQPRPKGLKQMRKEIDDSLASPVPFLSTQGFKRKSQKSDKYRKNHPRPSLNADSSVGKNKKSHKSKNRGSDELSQMKKRRTEC